jgi:hypothetical protein
MIEGMKSSRYVSIFCVFIPRLKWLAVDRVYVVRFSYAPSNHKHVTWGNGSSLDVLHLVCSVHMVYFYLLQHFGDAEALTEAIWYAVSSLTEGHCANEALQERQGLVNLIGLELMGNICS